MHAVYIHIDEALDAREQARVGKELRRLARVTDVELSPGQPHDLLVEYQPGQGMPMTILRRLAGLGLHADVMSC
ncbi:hypothetical protein [Thiohalobacter sp.]|uniref:hypothetical protein n=1 Tax=Thiohalobacter sp. TaxID=2025948 RepID=UPI00262DCCDE|nr:hypothetical protein [Thiohalobacter sp.]